MVAKKVVYLRGAYNLFNFGDDLALIAWLAFLYDFQKPGPGNLGIFIEKRFRSVALLKIAQNEMAEYSEAPDIAECINEQFIKFCIPIRFPSAFSLIRGIKKGRILSLIGSFFLSFIILFDLTCYQLFRKCFFIGKHIDFIKRIDVVHYIGGGYFTDWWRLFVSGEFLVILFYRIVNPHLRIAGTGLGIGPLKKKLNIFLFKTFVKRFCFLSLREEQSSDFIEALGLKINKATLGDDVLLLFPYFQKLKEFENLGACPHTALNFKDFFEHDYRLAGEQIDRYLAGQAPSSARIEYYCFGRKPGPDDFSLTALLKDNRSQPAIIHDPYEEGWLQFVGNLSRAQEAIGFAYHFGMIATILRVPVVSIYSKDYYKQKLMGGIKQLNRQAVIFSIDDVSTGRLSEALNTARAIDQNKIRDDMETKYKAMKFQYTSFYNGVLFLD
ncbi:MAG: polysaccharide pyruvyl transferase family protein [Candidatus Omnitrophica bacterium]|nr:polysaccharide pyruvyl transferase family protein [Candidatus Omnitrophota bacterium]